MTGRLGGPYKSMVWASLVLVLQMSLYVCARALHAVFKMHARKFQPDAMAGYAVGMQNTLHGAFFLKHQMWIF